MKKVIEFYLCEKKQCRCMVKKVTKEKKEEQKSVLYHFEEGLSFVPLLTSFDEIRACHVNPSKTSLAVCD